MFNMKIDTAPIHNLFPVRQESNTSPPVYQDLDDNHSALLPPPHRILGGQQQQLNADDKYRYTSQSPMLKQKSCLNLKTP